MSSLLQHDGGRSADGRKVRLLFYKVAKGPQWERYHGPASYNPDPNGTTFADPCERDDDGRPVLYAVYRRPAGMFGCWVVFRWNGDEHVPDLSVPIATLKLPRDAKRLPLEDARRYWTTE